MTKQDVEELLARIGLGPVLYNSPRWEVHEKGDGFLIQLVYLEPEAVADEFTCGACAGCHDDGVKERRRLTEEDDCLDPIRIDESGPPLEQRARKWYVSSRATRTEVVRTAHKAVLCSLEHRLGEWFTFDGQRPYSPHFDVMALTELDEREAFDLRGPR